MNRLNLQRALLFIGVMAIIAVLIYKGQTQHQIQKQEQAARQETKIAEQQRKTDEEAAAKKRQFEKEAAEQQRQVKNATAHAQFVNQYVNTNFTRTPGLPLVAVAVASENKTMNQALSAALISRFKGEHAQLVDSFFKPPLVSDDLFNDVFNGSSAIYTKLEIENLVDMLLLARQDVQYLTNSAGLDNVISAYMHVEVITMPVAGQFASRRWGFGANGTGFHPEEARMQAEERVIRLIKDKTDMTLGTISPKQ